MAEVQTFRSAFHGFNREDVVRYIEYLNNRHNDQVAQLSNELAQVREQLAAVQAAPVDSSDLEQQLAQALERCASLEAELAAAGSLLEEALDAKSNAQVSTENELEAYRRAERTERLARDRAERLYTQANGALAEATTLVDQAAEEIGTMSNSLAAQMSTFRDAVIGTKSVLADAAAALYAIRPCDDDHN